MKIHPKPRYAELNQLDLPIAAATAAKPRQHVSKCALMSSYDDGLRLKFVGHL